MPDKQTAWIENCRRQFCKIMKAKPDIISGGGECFFNFCGIFFWLEKFINRNWFLKINTGISIISQFSSVQSLSRVRLCERIHNINSRSPLTSGKFVILENRN